LNQANVAAHALEHNRFRLATNSTTDFQRLLVSSLFDAASIQG
jgi:hypothetical protein